MKNKKHRFHQVQTLIGGKHKTLQQYLVVLELDDHNNPVSSIIIKTREFKSFTPYYTGNLN